MGNELYDMFESLESSTTDYDRYEIIRAPFAWPGSKFRSLKHLLPLLPMRKGFCDVCGGSGVVTLNRPKSKIEILNDRHAGVTSFYRCLRDPTKTEKLTQWVEKTVHSREEWITCKKTWENVNDDVERAGRWWYMITYSFGALGRNFGRSTGSTTFAGKLRNRANELWAIHERLKYVQIENMDAIQLLKDYDSPEMVFYVDPDYNTDASVYKHRMKADYHRDLLEQIFQCQGFVAVSGYEQPLFENQDWDDRHEWEVYSSIQSINGEGNYKEHRKDFDKRSKAKEVLWIKEAS